MTTNKQKRAEGPRSPACENEKLSDHDLCIKTYDQDLFVINCQDAKKGK